MLPQGTIVKPGDKLARQAGYYNIRYTIVEVKKITPSGKIVLTNGERYSNDGYEIGGARFTKDTLHIITPEIEKNIARNDSLDYINGVEWKKLDDETLAEVVKLLKSRRDS